MATMCDQFASNARERKGTYLYELAVSGTRLPEVVPEGLLSKIISLLVTTMLDHCGMPETDTRRSAVGFESRSARYPLPVR
jgi:hypothetical protein